MSGQLRAKVNYGAARDQYEVDGLDLIGSPASTYGEPNKLNRIANPVHIPATGNLYSYEKWVSFECETEPEVPIDEIAIWGDDSQPASNVTWYGRVQTDYETPTQPGSITSISGTGTVSISGSSVMTGAGTSFLADFADGQLMRIPSVSHLFQPKSIDSDTQITLFRSYAGSASGAYMIEPYGRMDTYFDGSDDWHMLRISGVFQEVGDEHGFLVMVEEANASASAGECPATEDTRRIYYNWESTEDVYAPYNIVDSFTPAFDHRPSISGMYDLVMGKNDSTVEGRGPNIAGQNYENFSAYQGTLYGWVKTDWEGNDDTEHYLLDIHNGNDRLSLYKTESDNEIRFRITDGTTTSHAAVSSVAVSQGERVFLCARWDSSNTIDGTNYLKITVNNTSSGSATVPPVITVPDAIHWAEDYNGDSKWTGAIQLNIEERALSNSEVGSLYNSGAGQPWAATTDTRAHVINELVGDNPRLLQFPQGYSSTTDYRNKIDNGFQEADSGWTADANVTTSQSTTRKFGAKSRNITFAAGAADNAKAYMATDSLESKTYYLYDLWIRVSSLSDDIYLKVSRETSFNSLVVSRQINTGADDEGITYAAATWLHFAGVFLTGEAGVHYIGLFKTGTSAGAVLYTDQLRIHKSAHENYSCWLWEDIDFLNWEDLSYNWESMI